jgi:hypothetical protein
VTHEAFDTVLEKRIALIREVLVTKAAEYATNADRLHNFKRASEVTPGLTPAQHCLGFATKHWVSICDLVGELARGDRKKLPLLFEKVGDAINYLILLEAIIAEESRG